jgi:hypothetical protein
MDTEEISITINTSPVHYYQRQREPNELDTLVTNRVAALISAFVHYSDRTQTPPSLAQPSFIIPDPALTAENDG